MTVHTDYYYLLQLNIPSKLSSHEPKVSAAPIAVESEKHVKNRPSMDDPLRKEVLSNKDKEKPRTPSVKSVKIKAEMDASNSLEMQPLVTNAKNSDQLSQHSGGSGGSGGSAASTNSIANMHGRIQSFSKSSEQRGLGVGLKKLQLLLLLSLVLLALMSILKFVLVGNSLSTYMSSVCVD